MSNCAVIAAYYPAKDAAPGRHHGPVTEWRLCLHRKAAQFSSRNLDIFSSQSEKSLLFIPVFERSVYDDPKLQKEAGNGINRTSHENGWGSRVSPATVTKSDYFFIKYCLVLEM